MAEEKTYAGGCHCGRVRYEVTLALGRVVECNCSICGKVGARRTFVPADRFRLLSGEDQVVDYRFGEGRIGHTFCRTCGIHSFARGTGRDGIPTIAVNVRCLDDVDPDALEVHRFDGKSL